jgi:hypothetical protein
MSPSRQRVTRAVTRRVTLSADSIGLVVVSVRRSTPGTPSRTTAPRPEGPRGLRPETFRQVATNPCRSAPPIASFVSRAITGGQGPRRAGGRVVTQRIGSEGANRWRGWDLLRHRRETKAFPRMENRGGLVTHVPAYATPMRGRATISISPLVGRGEGQLGAVEVEADVAAIDPRRLVFPTGYSARINTAAAAASRSAHRTRERV